jgi:hypothetical protein
MSIENYQTTCLPFKVSKDLWAKGDRALFPFISKTSLN